jgi:hypothetical protein
MDDLSQNFTKGIQSSAANHQPGAGHLQQSRTSILPAKTRAIRARKAKRPKKWGVLSVSA